MPPEAPTDFAVGLHLSEKHGVVFMITKALGAPTGAPLRGTTWGHLGAPPGGTLGCERVEGDTNTAIEAATLIHTKP